MMIAGLPPSLVLSPATNVAEAQDAAPGTPARLILPRLGVNARVIDVGTQPDGKMAVPENGRTLGWYRFGPKPGDTGNAVIDGHVRTAKGPGTFSHLKDLKPGDEIRIVDEDGRTRTFRVREATEYRVADVPMQKLFGRTDGRHLNLITCAGTWDTTLGHYDKRLIIYADATDLGLEIL